MDALQAAVAALGMFYPGRNVNNLDNNYWSAVRLIAKLPTIVAAWVWNIRSDPNVELRIRGGTFAGVARELEDPAELAEAREALCETVNLFDYGECSVHLRGLPTRSKVKELHRYWFDTGIPLVVELVA